MLALSALAALAGCGKATPSPRAPKTTGASEERIYRDELFGSAIDSLGRLDEFESNDAFREITRQLQQASSNEVGDDPLLATWPQPAMLSQIIDRLNIWLRTEPKDDGWKVDPMVQALPEAYRQLPMMADLDRQELDRYDGFMLREAVWMRDVSNWTRGERLDDLSRARQLFDWTVRNVVIEPAHLGADGQPVAPIPQAAWEALYYGRGSAWERAWVFLLLARQQGIEAAVLGLRDEDPAKPPRPWALAVLSEGKAYLFDPVLGLPIPTTDGVAVNGSALRIKPATLSEVAQNESLLEQLGSDGAPYPVKAKDLERLVVMLEASPLYLAERSRLIESRLTGPQKIVLTTHPSALAERWKALPQVREVQLWSHPYTVLVERRKLTPRQVVQRLGSLVSFYGEGAAVALRRGRLLHLKGKLVGEGGAVGMYQQARPAQEDVVQEVQLNLERMGAQHKAQIEQLPSEERAAAAQRLEAQANLWIRTQIGITSRIKQDATFWLSELSFDRRQYVSASDYLAKRLSESDLGVWAYGAPYLLGRALEEGGNPKGAIALYRADKESPMYAGNRLRAAWLEKLLASPASASEVPQEAPATPETSETPAAPGEPAVEETPAPPG